MPRVYRGLPTSAHLARSTQTSPHAQERWSMRQRQANARSAGYLALHQTLWASRHVDLGDDWATSIQIWPTDVLQLIKHADYFVSLIHGVRVFSRG